MGQQAENSSETRAAMTNTLLMAEAFRELQPRIDFGLSGAAG
jgi:hypothetical protein